MYYFSSIFAGSSVRVLGPTNRVNTPTGFDPSWECFVDEISIGATQPQETNYMLCEQQQLVDGQHVVTVNVSQATQAGRTVWVDDIIYTPSSNVTSDGGYTLVDSIDPAIAYGDGWLDLFSFANFTSQIGTEFVFNFTGVLYRVISNKIFHADWEIIGIGLSWAGPIPTEFPHNSSSATYSIDGGSPVTFRLNGLPQGGSTLYNQIFFSTPQLPDGPHNLRVVHGGTAAETPLTFDYLVVTTGSSTATSTSSPTPTSMTPQPPDSHETPVGAIVGGVLGGIIAIILGLLFLVWRRKRRRNVQLQEDPKLPQDMSPLTIPTHDLSSGLLQTQTAQRDISYSTSPSLATASRLDPMSIVSVDPSPGAPMSTFESSRSTEPLGNAIRQQAKELVCLEYTRMEPVIHQDSGRRFHQNDGAEVPPGYTAD
jgi:hypothetical protein